MNEDYIDIVRGIRVPGMEKISDRSYIEALHLDGLYDYRDHIKKGIFYGGRDFSNLNIEQSCRGLSVITGFKPGARFHLGHILFAERIAFFQKNGADIHIITSSLENLLRKGEELTESNEDVRRFLSYLYSSADIDSQRVNIIDDKNEHIYELGLRLSRHCTSKQLEKIFGEDDGPISKRIFPLFIAASYLVPQDFCPDNKNLIIASPFHDPLISFTRKMAPKEGYKKPAAIYSKGVPNLTGKSLMTSKKDANTIYLDQDLSEIIERLRKMPSGGRAIEQHRLIGGDISNCPFFKIKCFLSHPDNLRNVVEGCANGNPCNECKNKNGEDLIQKIAAIKQKAGIIMSDIP